MHHQDAGSLAFDGVVVGVIADHFCAIDTLIGDFLGFDGGLNQPAHHQQTKGENDAHGRISCKKVIKTA
ncbi:hypothetical protein D3C71_2141460 [compost metagenome]